MSFTASSDAAPAGGEAAESSPQNASALEGSTSKALVLVTDEPAKSAVVDAAEVIASLRQVHSTAAEAVDAATAICRPYADIAAQLAQTMDSVRAVATAPAAVVATASRVSEIAAQLSSTVVLPQPAIVHAAKSATFLTGTVTSVANLAGQMRFPAIDTRTVAVQRSLADFAASVLQPPLIPRAVLETLIPVARTEHLLAQYARSISQPLLDAQARIAAAPWMKLDIAPLISSVQETVAAFGITSRLSAVVRASIEDWEAPFLMRDALKWAAVILDEAKGYRLVRWAKRALTAYATGDSLPLRTFIRNELKLTDRLDERCQALALAILEGLSALWQRESLFGEQGLRRVRGMIAAG
ncbi:hypothetical protein [Streptomyces scabiei]|uniref:hypothetical protein n=1 Tax=Streptomyces scabiei TaxID=1930 RepID=UPI0029B4D03C|nr:hypothetical protein [Streptomyces scabiei]MDX3127330.1 hypothetical protein [Streptomyces scabiei]